MEWWSGGVVEWWSDGLSGRRLKPSAKVRCIAFLQYFITPIPFILLSPARADVTLVAVGDVMMARGVERICRTKGWDYPFASTRAVLNGADITFGNLECSISRRGIKADRMFALRADPACLPALKRAGFSVMSVANNHTMDYGRDAFSDTLDGLVLNKIVPVGGGKTYAEATAGIVIQKNGLRIGIVGFSAFPGAAGTLSPNKPSMAVMSDEHLTASIKALKKKCDIVVVSCHWGIEGERSHSKMQERLAHRVIDAGAILVLGHHPHVPQESETYRGGVIVYSLGNFVFDEKTHSGPSGLFFRCRLSKNGVTPISKMPVKIERCQPRLLN